MEMERDISANKIYEEFPIFRDRSWLNAIKCKNDQNGFYVCFKNQCQNYSFMCSQKNCACKKDHEKCLKILLQDFLDKFQSKVVDLSSLIQQNDKLIDLFVQKIVNQAAKMKKTFRNQVQAKSKALSFNTEELKMLTCFQKNDVKNLKGKDFYRICTQVEQQQKLGNNGGINAKLQIEQGQIVWKNFQNKLKQQFNLIQRNIKQNKNGLYINKIGLNEGKIFNESKIAITTKEIYDLNNFFDKKIRKAELLYRASQNQFKVKNFKDKCCEISNTLTLIETQYGKKVGGFTPLVWKQTTQNAPTADTSNKTFIFSLTQNQKLLSIDNTNSGIANYPFYGPMFGKSVYNDLYISQSANSSKNSGISFNHGFKNPKFNQRNQQNHLKFNGSPNNQSNVKINQWQVWKITFQQK